LTKPYSSSHSESTAYGIADVLKFKAVTFYVKDNSVRLFLTHLILTECALLAFLLALFSRLFKDSSATKRITGKPQPGF